MPTRHEKLQAEKLVIAVEIARAYDHERNCMKPGGWRPLETRFNLSERRLQQIYQDYKRTSDAVEPNEVLKPRKKGRVGPKLQLTEEIATVIDESIIKEKGDITYRELQVELEKAGLPLSLGAVHKYAKVLGVHEESKYVKPKLTEKNKIERLKWVLSKIDVSDPNDLRYYHQNNIVHVDEKWMYVERLRKTVKSLPDHEDYPHDTVQHKSHRQKVMITAALTEPTETFDGKIAMIAHGDWVEAQRSSANRPRGTLEFKGKNVDADEFYDGQTKEGGILDMIVEKMQPEEFVQIQVDNAPAHTGQGVKERLQAFIENNHLEMEYVNQPANSPDFNMLDLALFNALQKNTDRIKKSKSPTIMNLLESCLEALEKYSAQLLKIAFGHLFACYNETLKIMGDNRYKSPHNDVRKKIRAGEPVNKVGISFAEYNRLMAVVANYEATH